MTYHPALRCPKRRAFVFAIVRPVWSPPFPNILLGGMVRRPFWEHPLGGTQHSADIARRVGEDGGTREDRRAY